jgi:hypothetical protein
MADGFNLRTLPVDYPVKGFDNANPCSEEKVCRGSFSRESI